VRHLYSGKVRDVYAFDDGLDMEPDGGLVAGRDAGELLLVVASDRISAYDHVLPTLIPDKGRVLTALSAWWFERLADLVPHHLVSVDDPRIPPEMHGRAMLCRRLEMVPVECVARGYLSGSGHAEYVSTGAVCEVPLPPGLVDGSRLPQPIFTPATKAPAGAHDENVSFDTLVARVGADLATELRRVTLAVYARAETIARERGILLADTKLELGHDPRTGELVLGDEVLTPDSSRFWSADAWSPGKAQASYDKQYVRDWLTSPASGWDRGSGAEPPPLPPEVVEATRERYVGAYERLTGHRFE
jgi:phosphoribosylaminoimidazole-succinocarboxamide synthase